MESVSFDVSKFNPKPSSELMCAICHCVIHVARMLTCQHIFCKSCIEEWLLRSPTCPTCREHMAKEWLQPAPPLVQNVLNSLTMNCDFKENGCEESIIMEKFISHLSICEYKTVSCPHKDCQVQSTVRDMHKHKEDCQYRRIQCDGKCSEWFQACKIKDHDCLTTLKEKVKEYSDVVNKHHMVFKWIRNKLNNTELPFLTQYLQLCAFKKMVSDINQHWPANQSLPVLLCGDSCLSSVSDENNTDFTSSENADISNSEETLLHSLVFESSRLQHSISSDHDAIELEQNAHDQHHLHTQIVEHAANFFPSGHESDHDDELDRPSNAQSLGLELQSYSTGHVETDHNLPYVLQISNQIAGSVDQSSDFSQRTSGYSASLTEQNHLISYTISRIPEQSMPDDVDEESFRSAYSDDENTAYRPTSDRVFDNSSYSHSPRNVSDSDNTGYPSQGFSMHWDNDTYDSESQHSQWQLNRRSRSRSNSSTRRHHSSHRQTGGHNPGDSRSESMSLRRNDSRSRNNSWSSNESFGSQTRGRHNPSWNPQNSASCSYSCSSTGSYFSSNLTSPQEEIRDNDREVISAGNIINGGSYDDDNLLPTWENTYDSSDDDSSETEHSQEIETYCQSFSVQMCSQSPVYPVHRLPVNPIHTHFHCGTGTSDMDYEDQQIEREERNERSNCDLRLQISTENNNSENIIVASSVEAGSSLPDSLSPGHVIESGEGNSLSDAMNGGQFEQESPAQGILEHVERDGDHEHRDRSMVHYDSSHTNCAINPHLHDTELSRNSGFTPTDAFIRDPLTSSLAVPQIYSHDVIGETVSAGDISPVSGRYKQTSSNVNNCGSAECNSAKLEQKLDDNVSLRSDRDGGRSDIKKKKKTSSAKGKGLLKRKGIKLQSSNPSGNNEYDDPDSHCSRGAKFKKLLHVSSDYETSSQEDLSLHTGSEDKTKVIAIELPSTSTSQPSVLPKPACREHFESNSTKKKVFSKDGHFQKHYQVSKKKKKDKTKPHLPKKKSRSQRNGPKRKESVQQNLGCEQYSYKTYGLKHSKLSKGLRVKLVRTSVSSHGAGTTDSYMGSQDSTRPEVMAGTNCATDGKNRKLSSKSSGRQQLTTRNVEADRNRQHERMVSENDQPCRQEEGRNGSRRSTFHTKRTRDRQAVSESTKMVVIPDLPIPPSTMELLFQSVDTDDESDRTWTPDTEASDSASETEETDGNVGEFFTRKDQHSL